MESLLEQQRRLHEERERLIDAIVQDQLLKKNSIREQINSDHRCRQLLDRFIECTNKVKDLYEDKDNLRKEEIKAISGPNEFAEFYARLKDLKEFHKSHPNEITVPMSVEFEEMKKSRENPSEDVVDFTDEEGYGRYLDLHDCYEAFINIKGMDKIDYLAYLEVFDKLADIPKERKNADYKRYMEKLVQYMVEFIYRVKPLLDTEEEMHFVDREFNDTWEDGKFPGWPRETGGALAKSGAHLDISAFSSAEEVASLGLDRLKSALMALGLKCGGTLEERAQRLFGTKGKRLDELDPSLFARSKAGKVVRASNPDKMKDYAMLEARIYRLTEILKEQRHATKENVLRKLARTGAEREEESESEEEVHESEEEKDDDVIYNPKNLPLGWDGKPIPYWLYKLHGLNIYYNCEICGNIQYRGPKAFQQHFAEWRHAHGMRCLGIPNTAHFANVTKIEDALALWERIRTEKEVERWRPDLEEEYEDSAGNVVTRKVYEDLKRQGLL